MTGGIQGINTENFYQELGLESLQNRSKLLRLCLFYKIYKDHTPPDLRNVILKNFKSSYSLRATTEISLFRMKHGFFKSFSPSMIIEWNDLDYSLRNARFN